MAETIIEIEVDLIPDDYRRTLYWYHKTRLIINGLIATFIGIVCGFAGVYFMVTSVALEPSFANVFLIILAILLPGLFFLLAAHLNIRSQVKNIMRMVETTKFTFTSHRLEMVSHSSSSQIAWRKLFKVCETKDAFIFFVQKNLFYPVPKRFFQNPQQVDEFRELLVDNLGDKAKLLAV